MRSPADVEFAIRGRPVPWSRAEDGARGVKFTNERHARAMRDVKWLVKPEMRGRPPFIGPVQIEIRAFFAAAKSKQQLVGKPHDATPDIDNVAKLILDACKGIVWKDDRQVFQMLASAWWCGEREQKTLVRIWRWEQSDGAQLSLLDRPSIDGLPTDLPKTRTIRTYG